MDIDHATLIEYLLGILDSPACEQIERALASSSEHRKLLAQAEKLLNDVNQSVYPLTPGDRLRDRLMASLDPTTPFEGFVDRLKAFFDLDGDQLRRLLNTVNAVPRLPWEPSGLPGVHFLHFTAGPRVATADCGLVYMEPKQRVPKYKHYGEEWALILQGSIREDDGKVWSPGDLIYKAADSAHSFQVLGDEPLVFAVILHKGFEWISK
jgi:quercetin dioxygenase-like cupin family protein